MKTIEVRFKNGKVDIFKYDDDILFALDMDTVQMVMNSPRETSGYIGQMSEGFFINVLDISAIRILEN